MHGHCQNFEPVKYEIVTQIHYACISTVALDIFVYVYIWCFTCTGIGVNSEKITEV